MWVVETPSALDGGAVNITRFTERAVAAVLTPCATYDAFETTQYLVNRSSLSTLGYLQIYTITGPPGAPVFDAIVSRPSAPGWSPVPLSGAQAGSNSTIATNDDRLMNAVLRNGRL